MNQLENLPPVKWAMTHPRIAAWIILSLGMVILLVIEARDVGLTAGNWIALIVATVLVAGACIWIVSWEDVEESEPVPGKIGKTSTAEMRAVKVEETSETAEGASTDSDEKPA